MIYTDKKISVTITCFLITFFVLLIFGCGDPPGAPPLASGAIEYAPDFTLYDLDSNLVTLSNLEGEVVFLYFFANT